MSLYEFAGPDHREVADQAAVICTALLSDGAPSMDHFLAAGLIAPNAASGELKPFVAKKPWPGGPEAGSQWRLDKFDDELTRLGSVIGEKLDWLGSVLIWVLPSPVPQVALGEKIYHGVAQGTRGFDVTWTGGSGFLTAGHVAPVLKGGILDASLSTIVGEVQAFSDPNGSGYAPKRDVAVVRWWRRDLWQAHYPRLTGVGATGGSLIDVHRPTGQVRATVTAYAPYWVSSVISGTYGRVYVTTQCVTTDGDSGAAALTPSGGAVGTVVAGIPGFATLVQDVRYQLSGMNTLPNILL